VKSRLLKTAVAAGSVTVLLPVVVLGAVAVGLQQMPADATPSSDALSDIPPYLLALYQQDALLCPGLPWPVLAGIGKVESNHNRPPGQVSSAGAQGPMQFLPATWASYGLDGDADGRSDPFDPADAIPAAADYLCRLGAGRDLAAAVASYTCGAITSCLGNAVGPEGYATRVLAWAARYSNPSLAGDAAATIAVQTALSQVGTPYVWGGEDPTTGFDCSGLVQYAYAAAGPQLPRTAQTQYDRGPLLPLVVTLAPGDLVFFGSDASHVSHVGIALGQGRMVDAPHTGALVRVEPIAGFGANPSGRQHYLGATRPAAAAGTSAMPLTASLGGPS
jgi:cell wall-associated NlpC family hydrolase